MSKTTIEETVEKILYPYDIDAPEALKKEIVDLLTTQQEEPVKEMRENLIGVATALKKIRDIDQRRCDEAAKNGELYDVSITSWAQTAERLLDSLTPLQD